MTLPSPVDMDNMYMPIIQDNVAKYNIDQELSIYIPYVSMDGDFIKDTIQDFGFGKVERVDCVARGNDDTTSMAFIHMKYWEENALVENFQYRIKTSDMEARIVYDDPKYWIILPNKNPMNIDVNKKINNMQCEIDILRKYNEQLNEKLKNLRWFINHHETNIEYLCKEITNLKVHNSKSYSEEESENYLKDEYNEQFVIHKNKRIRSLPIDNTCGDKSLAWEPSRSSIVKKLWNGRLRPRENGIVMKPYMYSEC